MAGIIRIYSGSGGKANKAPTIRNFRQDGKIDSTYFNVKYIAEDFENTILRHYVYINGNKKEITKDVGYESGNNEFTYRVDNLTLNTRYSIQIEVSDGIDTVRSDTISVTTANYQVFGVRVMENNSNSNSSVSYIEGAVGLRNANRSSLNDWSDRFPFNKIRLVGFKNGQVTKEINPNRKTHYLSGEAVPSDVDVMVEIPKVYWKFTNISNGYELRIANYKIDGSYDCYAHKVGGIEKDYIYVGAYLGYVEGGKLRSKSGVSPTGYVEMNNFRLYAQGNGRGYQQWNWYTLTLIQILYLIAYKNLDSQTALGMGFVSGSNSSTKNTGGTNTKGLYYGSSNDREQMCFLGIEDFYGNLRQWVDGTYVDSSYNFLVTNDNRNFNDDGSGYNNLGKYSNRSGYINSVAHTNQAGFFPRENNGSVTTYYADYAYVDSYCVGCSGGYWSEGGSAGTFYLYVHYTASSASSYFGSRLVFLG